MQEDKMTRTKTQTPKSRWWKLLEQLGYQVDDGERRLVVRPGQHPVTKDLFGVADLICIPRIGFGTGTLYVQIAIDHSDHEKHKRKYLQPELIAKIERIVRTGNRFVICSHVGAKPKCGFNGVPRTTEYSFNSDGVIFSEKGYPDETFTIFHRTPLERLQAKLKKANALSEANLDG